MDLRGVGWRVPLFKRAKVPPLRWGGVGERLVYILEQGVWPANHCFRSRDEVYSFLSYPTRVGGIYTRLHLVQMKIKMKKTKGKKRYICTPTFSSDIKLSNDRKGVTYCHIHRQILKKKKKEVVLGV